MIHGLFDFLQGLGPLGILLYIPIYVVGNLFFIPNPLTFALAGALYGIQEGFIVTSLASAISAGLFFLLGRHFSRDWILKKIEAHKKIRMIDEAVTEKGWRMVFLLRLTALLPFSVMNYILGLSKIPFWPYLLASWLGMMPGILLYVYLGSFGGRIFLQDAARQKSPMEWVLIAVSVLVTFAIGIYATNMVRKILSEEEKIHEKTK